MKLIKITCPNCDAPLEYEQGQKRLQCKYCDTNLILDDETIKIEHILQSSDKVERAKNAEAAMKFKEYSKAYYMYKSLCDDYSYEPEFWYNFLLSLTHNYKYTLKFTRLYSYSDYSYHLKCVEIAKGYDEYIKKCEKIFNRYSKVEEDEELLKDREKDYNKYIKNINSSYDEELKVALDTRNDTIARTKKGTKAALGFIGFFLIIALLAFLFSYFEHEEERKQKELENNIACTVKCNDNKDVIYDMYEVKNNNPLYCHVTLTEGYKDKEYDLSYDYFIESTYFRGNKFNFQFTKGTSGYIYWDALPLTPGKYTIFIYNENEKEICHNSIKVVDYE